MMFSLHGKDEEAGDVDAFRYFLATELGKMPHELDEMPVYDYVAFAAYYEAKQAMEGVRSGRQPNH